jgi:hypothetical protein
MNIFQPTLTVIESPFKASDFYTEEQHKLYLLHAIEDSVNRGEAPFASHHYLVEVLEDDDPLQRQYGIKCGIAWGQHADLVAVYSDLGCSDGMKAAIEHYSRLGKRIEWRKLPDKVVASIKKYGEFTQEEPLDESSTLGIHSPAVSFADR